MNKPSWVLVALFIVLLAIGTATAQTSKVLVGSMSNSHPTGNLTDTQLLAGSNHTLEIRWDGTGLTGNILTTNVWLLHGTADWGIIESERVGLTLRFFIDDPNGTLNFGVIPQHMGWHKIGGSGDPDFGNPGTAIKEPDDSLIAGPYGNNTTGSDTVAILLGLISTGPGWEPAVNPVGPAIEVHFSTLLADHGKTICLDTISNPLGAWEWAPIGAPSISPEWDNGLGSSDTRCWVVIDPNAPDPTNMILSSDTLYYGAVEGGANPSTQSVNISSDNIPLSLTLTENSSWLLKSPSSGNTPLDVNVSITTTGLIAGQYTDSIQVTATGADNSPQFIFVNLDLSEPPPEIGVAPLSFLFNAVADSGNPAPQILSITNAGQSTLNWSVTNNQPWLSLTPGAGVNSGQVSLSVDITGLPFGDYFDVIEVSDPFATNDPVQVPVQLTIASDLPLIEVDPTNYYWVFDFNSPVPLVRSFEVRNAGGGSLSFWGESTSRNVSAITPAIAIAPDSLFVHFTFDVTGIGFEVTDTIMVMSNDATNSPQPVYIHQRLVLQPAIIGLSTDTITFEVFECTQGYGNGLQTDSFTVSNIGGDNPMYIDLDYQSDLFSISTGTDSLLAPSTTVLTALEAGLPPGVYYDTIIVTSKWAANKPQMLIIKYVSKSGVSSPEILLIDDSITVFYQQDSGPKAVPAIEIHNKFGGCMPWEFTSFPSWLTVNTLSGEVPGSTDFFVNPVGFGIGEYVGSAVIESPGAVNSPLTLPVVLQVWQERGDVNWNGRLTIQDVVLLTDYLLDSGNPPKPALIVGDTNCDDQISVVDITRLIDRLFISLQPICGNA